MARETQTMLIKELFDKDIYRNIEEVIKVEQSDEATVIQEIQEYVVTDSLKEYFYTVYDAVAEYPSDPHEGIGIWLSGFFGSGKSSFAKILGYTLANVKLGEKTASQWFMETAKDDRIATYLKNINKRFRFHLVIFDVSQEKGAISDQLSEIMYKALLKSLGYSSDFNLAELEITLEKKGLLEDFVARFDREYEEGWEEERELVLGINKASHILHLMMPDTFPSPDSWSNSLSTEGSGDFKGRVDISPNLLAQRAFELTLRRRPGHGVVFVIDEVGQHISRSVDRMLDLQGIVQALGIESKNRVKRGQSPAPCWLVVTSQEKLDEIVDALGDKRVELARLQDRFRIAIDLKPSDIEEVAAKRILSKKAEAGKILDKLYAENEGRLKTFTTLERTKRRQDITPREFTKLYPYLPYQLDLSIEIVDGLRGRREGLGHLGGSNRTIIKQTQQMLVHDRTKMAEKEIGNLVTLDKIYELLYAGNLLPSELSKEIDTIPERLKGDEMALRVAKAIALMEVVKDLPRTPRNIAAVLYPDLSSGSLEGEVKKALATLEEAQFVRKSEQGYRLLTLQEKNWETERNKKSPKPKEQNLIKEEMVKEVIEDTGIRNFKYLNLKTFKVGLVLNGNKLEDGQVSLWLRCLDPEEDLDAAKEEARKQSREEEGKKTLFWVFRLTEDAFRMIVELYRSRAMINVYEQLRGQERISTEEKTCLEDEKSRENEILRQLKSEMEKAMQTGYAYFQGEEKAADSLGDDLREMLRKYLEKAIPILYDKLELFAKPVKGNEPEVLLTAANLGGLPKVFYGGEDGLDLVVKQEENWVPNLSAPAAKEVLDYLKREHDYGNKVTGKDLEKHFGDMPYGADVDVLRLVTALLFRAGSIEVTHQGKKYKDYNNRQAHAPFVKNLDFRSTTFSPREGISLQVLSKAAKAYESITGEEVDVEEGDIHRSLCAWASRVLGDLAPVLATLSASSLPGEEAVRELEQDLLFFRESESEECVGKLAGEGKTLKEQYERFQSIKRALERDAAKTISKARLAIGKMYPVLQSLHQDEGIDEAAEDLRNILEAEDVYNQLELLREKTEYISGRYGQAYAELHQERHERMSRCIDDLKKDPAWGSLDEADRENILKPISSRACGSLEMDDEGLACKNCKASVPEIQSDLLATEGLYAEARRRMDVLIHPEPVERIKVSHLARGLIEDDDDLRFFLATLEKELKKLLAEGKKIALE